MANEKRLIDANELIEDLEAAKANAGMGATIASTLIRYVKRCPTVDAVEVVHGNWLDVFTGFNFFAATCSVCHKRSDLPPIAVAKYCPRCGARMDGDGNDSEC